MRKRRFKRITLTDIIVWGIGLYHRSRGHLWIDHNPG